MNDIFEPKSVKPESQVFSNGASQSFDMSITALPPSHGTLLDRRPEQERIADFLSDLEELHKLYRNLNSYGNVRGTKQHLFSWASQIGRTIYNKQVKPPMRPVGAQRKHMLEFINTERIEHSSEIQDLLLADDNQPSSWQSKQALKYTRYLVAQVKHSCELESKNHLVAFPIHFEPGAALLAMKHFGDAFTQEEFDAGTRLLSPMLNLWYLRRYSSN